MKYTINYSDFERRGWCAVTGSRQFFDMARAQVARYTQVTCPSGTVREYPGADAGDKLARCVKRATELGIDIDLCETYRSETR